MTLPFTDPTAAGAPAIPLAAQDTDTAPELVEVAATSLLEIGHSDGLIAFADAMASFAHESAALGGIVDSAGNHAAAWATTFGVLLVDAILIATWQESRRRKTRAALNRNLFSMRLISP